MNLYLKTQEKQPQMYSLDQSVPGKILHILIWFSLLKGKTHWTSIELLQSKTAVNFLPNFFLLHYLLYIYRFIRLVKYNKQLFKRTDSTVVQNITVLVFRDDIISTFLMVVIIYNFFINVFIIGVLIALLITYSCWSTLWQANSLAV